MDELIIGVGILLIFGSLIYAIWDGFVDVSDTCWHGNDPKLCDLCHMEQKRGGL